jgi:Cu+-exporting ATPase
MYAAGVEGIVMKTSAAVGEKSGAAQPNGSTELLVEGMNCGNCAHHVAEAIQSVGAVRSAAVDLGARRATVRWKEGVGADIPAVIEAISVAGYKARTIEKHAPGEAPAHDRSSWPLNLWVGAACTIPLMAGEWIFGLAARPWFQWISLMLATLVQVIGGTPFYRGAWRQLKAGASNMDTLVALGSTTAFGFSVWTLLSGQGGHLFFMEAASIITIISIGHWLESRVGARASSALRQLLDLAPPTARRRLADGSESCVPVGELTKGDCVMLRPGDRVPTDGLVLGGNSAVDEAMLTGESVPLDKTIGSRLCAGTIVQNGQLVMEVTATGSDTALAQVVAAVQRAQSSRANIQRLGDRVSSVFVPVVVVAAVAAGLWWGIDHSSAQHVHDTMARFLWHAHAPDGTFAAGIIVAAAVLIVACPCAMGLATPAAIMAAANVAARRGILIRDGVALEKAGRVTAVVFDKTGTLTTGKHAVVRVWTPPGGLDPAAVRSLAGALAERSTHPLSRAVSQLRAAPIAIADWEEMPGLGIRAKVSPVGSTGSVPSDTASFGSLRWLKEAGVDLTAGEAFVHEWGGQGATLVGLAVNGSFLGLFALRDTLKPGVRQVLEQLRALELKTYLVTGDHVLTARNIANQVGVEPEHVLAEARPEQKANFVRQLQEQGERVAFVGDGINDAPALEQADLGVAVSQASDVAREAADIILLNSEVSAIPESLGLARAAMRTIRQNLFWAFFYNALGVPLAALGFMSPVLCAATMGISDLIVIGNALRLRNWRCPATPMAL